MSRRRRLLLAAALLPFAYLALWPVDADPEAWTPPEAPALAGAYAVNDGLAGHTVLHPEYHGPEAVTFDGEGRIVTGLLDGRIVRFAADGSGPGEALADTGGRPLGLRYDREGRLVVADAHRGLLRLGDAGAVEVLVDTHGGKPIRFCDDLAIAGDGTIYFSDASFVRSVEEWRIEVIEHRPNGRLLAYHPDTRETTLVLGDLYFANGVALGPDDASVVVTELSSYRVQRVWLAGPRKGQVEVMVDNLAGFPDNITYSPERRVYWIALGSPRNGLVDALAGSPFLRKVVLRLPEALQPAPVKHAFAVAIDESGAVVAAPQYVDPSAYSPVSSVLERDGWLYLGSFAGDGIARVKAPAGASAPPVVAAPTEPTPSAAVGSESGPAAVTGADAGAVVDPGPAAPTHTPAAPAVGDAADTRITTLGNAEFFRSSAASKAPWDAVEVTNVFGFLKRPDTGKTVTCLPVEVDGPALALKITGTKRRAEEAPVWWEVALEPVTAREYFDLAPPRDHAEPFLGHVAVLYPALPDAVLLDPASIDPKDLPAGVAPAVIEFAVDSTGDRRPDGIETSFCCDDESKPEASGCDYTCSRTYLRQKGAWVEVHFSQPA